jgi:hypothetical protein
MECYYQHDCNIFNVESFTTHQKKAFDSIIRNTSKQQLSAHIFQTLFQHQWSILNHAQARVDHYILACMDNPKSKMSFELSMMLDMATRSLFFLIFVQNGKNKFMFYTFKVPLTPNMIFFCMCNIWVILRRNAIYLYSKKFHLDQLFHCQSFRIWCQ